MEKLASKFFEWRVRHISDRQFIYILAHVVGILSGLAAILLKNTVHYAHFLLTDGFGIIRNNYIFFVSPLLGITLTVLFVKYFVRDNIGHGVSRILYSISKNNSRLKPHNTWTSMVASTFTIAFGGSVGAEAPIVLTGSAIGSNLGRLARLNYRTTTLMIGCGAAGAIAGIFKAPIAGIIFAVEVLMLDLTLATLIPLLISASTASVLSYFLLGKSVLFNFTLNTPFQLGTIPFYILLGILAGAVSIYFTRASGYIESKFKNIENVWKKILFGGLLLGVLIFFFPSLFGEGYDSLLAILNGNGDIIVTQSFFAEFAKNPWFIPLILLLILFFKVVAMAVTTGSGGVGGVFAPALFMGGVTGLFLSRVINLVSPYKVNESNFSLVGMAGVMAGVMHAPLTAIFLIAEITGGYQLLSPLIITATIAFITVQIFEPHSIYAKRLAERGELITHHKDKAVLSRMKVTELIERNFLTVDKDATLGEFVKIVAQSERNVFPVVDKDRVFLGVVFINDIREQIFNHELYNEVYVRDVMFMPDVSVSPNDSMEDVAKLFQQTPHYNLPVIKEGKYIGFVSRANVFSKYRGMLKESSED
ncbi:MAG: chloride channel protein [Bacteroidales bacterium]|nr:chloride channel protein [Bacteroidales bacterium]